MKSKARSTIYIRAALAMLFAVAITSTAHSQTKVVERSRALPNAPVELSELKSHDQPLKFGRSFEGGTEWLKGLSFSVKNISQKDITFIAIAIDFTEIKIPSIFRHERFLGRPVNTKCCQHLPLLTLKAGESLRMLISEEYKEFGETVEKYYGSASLSTITIVLGQVQFKDGTMWDQGEFYRIDTERPGKWVQVE
jgi:hypothetical protein